MVIITFTEYLVRAVLSTNQLIDKTFDNEADARTWAESVVPVGSTQQGGTVTWTFIMRMTTERDDVTGVHKLLSSDKIYEAGSQAAALTATETIHQEQQALYQTATTPPPELVVIDLSVEPPYTGEITWMEVGASIANAQPINVVLGAETTLIATPLAGFKFARWEGPGGITLMDNVLKTYPTVSGFVKAVFEEKPPEVVTVTSAPSEVTGGQVEQIIATAYETQLTIPTPTKPFAIPSNLILYGIIGFFLYAMFLGSRKGREHKK